MKQQNYMQFTIKMGFFDKINNQWCSGKFGTGGTLGTLEVH